MRFFTFFPDLDTMHLLSGEQERGFTDSFTQSESLFSHLFETLPTWIVTVIIIKTLWLFLSRVS